MAGSGSRQTNQAGPSVLNGNRLVSNGLLRALDQIAAQAAGADRHALRGAIHHHAYLLRVRSPSAARLAVGAAHIVAIHNALTANLTKLSEEVDKLDAAVKQIRDGAVKLSDSINAADLTGLTAQIAEAAKKLEASTDDLHALLKAADEYNNFAGLAKGSTGTVRFVYRTASIGE